MEPHALRLCPPVSFGLSSLSGAREGVLGTDWILANTSRLIGTSWRASRHLPLSTPSSSCLYIKLIWRTGQVPSSCNITRAQKLIRAVQGETFQCWPPQTTDKQMRLFANVEVFIMLMSLPPLTADFGHPRGPCTSYCLRPLESKAHTHEETSLLKKEQPRAGKCSQQPRPTVQCTPWKSPACRI